MRKSVIICYLFSARLPLKGHTNLNKPAYFSYTFVLNLFKYI